MRVASDADQSQGFKDQSAVFCSHSAHNVFSLLVTLAAHCKRPNTLAFPKSPLRSSHDVPVIEPAVPGPSFAYQLKSFRHDTGRLCNIRQMNWDTKRMRHTKKRKEFGSSDCRTISRSIKSVERPGLDVTDRLHWREIRSREHLSPSLPVENS